MHALISAVLQYRLSVAVSGGSLRRWGEFAEGEPLSHRYPPSSNSPACESLKESLRQLSRRWID